MISLIVLIHDQAKNLDRLTRAYLGLVEKPDLFVFVCDRCKDDSVERLKVLASKIDVRCEIVEVWEDSKFTAGKNRDIGLTAADSIFPNSDVVFLDGDCVPHPMLVAEHKACLSLNANYPIATIGTRLNESKTDANRVIIDNRMTHFTYFNQIFTAGRNRLVLARDPAFSRMLTWSCNLGMNRKMIGLLRSCIERLSGHARVFHPAFDGQWGGEDDFVGIASSYLGAAVIAVKPEHGVTHIWHESRQNQKYARQVALQTGRMRDLAKLQCMPGVSEISAPMTANQTSRIAKAWRSKVRSEITALVTSKFQGVEMVAAVEVCSPAVAYNWHIDKDTEVVPTVDWSDFKDKLKSVYDSFVDASIVSTFKYCWPGFIDKACTICYSRKGIAPNGRCLNCSAFPWHRLMHGHMKRESSKVKIAFNAETLGERKSLEGWSFRSFSGLFGDAKADLSNLSDVESDSVDAVYHTHTLEHVRDDGKALREMHRVLKVGGKAYVAIPMTVGITRENLSESLSPKERLNSFWWHDHWRIYGLDVVQRFKAFGFSVDLIPNNGDIPSVASDEIGFILTKTQDAKVRKPTNLYLDVANSCNYSCNHCKIHMLKDNGQVNVDAYSKIIEEFKDLGGQTIGFNSGEPLMFPVTLEVARKAKSVGLGVDLVTNGSRTSKLDDFTKEVAKLCDSVTLSIDSHLAENHDAIRGSRGAFDRAIQSMTNLKIAGCRTVKAACVLTSDNLAAFPAYAKFMSKAGFDEVGFTILEPTFALGRFSQDTYYEAKRLKDGSAFVFCVNEAKLYAKIDISDADLVLLAKSISDGIEQGTCDSSSKNLIVTRDFKVKLCYSKPSIGVWSDKASLESLWNSSVSELRRAADAQCIASCAVSNCHRRSTP